MLKTYGKALAAIALAVVTAVQAYLSDGHLTTQEDVQILIAAVTAAGVWLVPVVPGAPWMKTAVGWLLVVLNVLVTLVVGGMRSGDWTGLIIAGLTALGVTVMPARSTVTGTVAVPPGADGPLT